MPARRYLVTGGLGYAGSWVTWRLARQGHQVFVLSRGENTPDIGAPYTLVRADVGNSTAEELAALLPDRLDGVAHAASANDAFEPGYGRKALLVNALGTRTLAEALVLRAEKTRQPLPMLCYFSTFHVYGQSAGKITENTPPEPRGEYGLTHFFAEEYCRLFMRAKGLPCVIIRPTNGYGAPKAAPFGKWYLLLNDLCRSAYSTGRIVLRSDPSIARDFVWLGDVARTVEALLAAPELAGSVFNIASGTTLTLGEVARRTAKAASEHLGTEVPLHLEYQERSTPGAAPPAPLYVDNSAAKAALGLSFQDHMEEEIHRIFAWIAQHGAPS